MPPAVCGGADLYEHSFTTDEREPPQEPVVAEDDLLGNVRRIWADLLDDTDVGVDVNFFDAGGDSLSFVVLLERINRFSGLELEAAELFQYSTIRDQAEFLRAPREQRATATIGARDRKLLLGRARRVRE
jgi:aryl carrier-like protein